MKTMEPRSRHDLQKSARIQGTSTWDLVERGVYGIDLAIALSAWFVAIRAPLWLDETGSFFQISDGFSRIWSRQGGVFVAYYYILWLATKVVGTSETALRIPSLLAMLAAAYLLFLTARELCDGNAALIATAIFCVHPIVVFEAIDARPYAFIALVANAAIFILVRLRRNRSTWTAALFGVLAALILYFQIVDAVILPALALVFVAGTVSESKVFWRQTASALLAFAAVSLPAIPSVLYIFHTRGTHVFEPRPGFIELLWTIAPGWIVLIAGLILLLATATKHPFVPDKLEGSRIFLCISIGFIPILILYGVSVTTPIHVFVARYRLVAIPGIALCWALLISRVNSRSLRLLFCVALVGVTAYHAFTSPESRTHGYTWKYALAAAEKNAAPDNTPVLICSDLVESDYAHMPISSVKESSLFAPLSYYKLSVPVVPLPRAVNDEAIRVASAFLRDAAPHHQRFLALAFRPSYPTLDWLVKATAGTYHSRVLGTFDGVRVLEFNPIGRRVAL